MEESCRLPSNYLRLLRLYNELAFPPKHISLHKNAARILVRHIGIFGCPSQIVSDRGTHFTADIIQELMVLVGTNHVLTSAASKQENAAVENANKRSQEYLRSMLFDNRILKRWSADVTVSAAYHDGRAQ